MDVFALFARLGIPFCGISHTVGHPLAKDAVVHLSLLQLQEEACHSAFPIRKIFYGELFCLQDVEEFLCEAFHVAFSVLANGFQLLDILLHESLLFHLLHQRLPLFLVVVAEDGSAKLLHLSDDVPRAIIVDGIHDIAEQPLEQDVRMRQRVDQLVYRLFLHLHVIESHAIVGTEFQFTCQIAKHLLEEGIDGLHMEETVVVQQQA